MRWSEIPFHPTRTQLRQFAGLCLLFFGALASWQWFRYENSVAALIFTGLALVLGVGGLLFPRAVRFVFVGWMILAFPIGWVVSHVLLAILFYGIFLPLGLVFKMMGRDSLDRRRLVNTTYWKPKANPSNIKSYFRQF